MTAVREWGIQLWLDPMDVYRLCTNLGKTPQELVSAGLIQFEAMVGTFCLIFA